MDKRSRVLASALGGCVLLAGSRTVPGAGIHAPAMARSLSAARCERGGEARLNGWRAPRIKVRDGLSTNWSGYSAHNGSFTDARGTWIVPTANSSSCQVTYSSSWVGIDGDGSSTVEQCGTDQDYINGQANYYAWYEFYPNPSVSLSTRTYPVSPGDSITAEVRFNGGNSFTVSLISSRGWSFIKSQKVSNARRASAEWIEEAPSSFFGVLNLTNFGTVSFSNCTAAQNNGPSLGIGNWSYDPITMVDGSSATEAFPSGLSGGNSFTDTWANCH